MIKNVTPESFGFTEALAYMMKVSSRGLIGSDRNEFVKRAGHDFLPYLDQVRPGEVPIHWLAVGATEKYGCFPPGTTVRMGDADLRPIETIGIGETVITHRGRPRPVLNIFQKKFNGNFYRIEVQGQMDPIQCTPNHQFFVIPRAQVACEIDSAGHCKPDTVGAQYICTSRHCPKVQVSYHPEWRSAEQLECGDYALVPIPGHKIGKQAHNFSVPFARTLGYFLAEGCYEKGARLTKTTASSKKVKRVVGLNFSFAKNEEHTLVADLQAQLRELDYFDMTIQGPYINNEDGTCVLRAHSASLASRVRSLCGEYADGKFLDGKIFAQRPEILAHLIATYYDGDGTQPDCDGRPTASSRSRRLILDLQWLLARLRLPTSTGEFGPYHYAYSKPGSGPRHHLSFATRHLDKIVAYSSKLSLHTPKQLKAWAFEWNGYICYPIRRIELSPYTGTVHNLEVEEDHSYTVGNGVAVHNSNRNADAFGQIACRRYHDTFVKLGHYFHDHLNKQACKNYGRIIASVYNEPMARIELLIGLNGTKEAAERNGGLVATRDLEKIARDELIPGSMACYVPYDICSGCGNRGRNRNEYCDTQTVKYAGRTIPPCTRFGCKRGLTKVAADGFVQYVDNDQPKWFDFSGVYRNADRIAVSSGVLEKAANLDFVLGGAELAERLRITAPYRLLEADPTLPIPAQRQIKLAVALADREGSAAMPSGHDLAMHHSVNEKLAAAPDVDLDHALRALADERVLLSVGEWLHLALGKEAAVSALDEVAAQLPGVYGRYVNSPTFDAAVSNNPYTPSRDLPPTAVRMWAMKVASQRSMARSAVETRMKLAALRGAIHTPPRTLTKEAQLIIEEQAGAEKLAQQYALYQLAFLDHIRDDPEVHFIADMALRTNLHVA